MQKNQRLLILILSFISVSAVCEQKSGMQISSLTCEYLENPLGIDVPSPMLSWKLLSDGKDVSQSAYRILVASSLALLDENDWEAQWIEASAIYSWPEFKAQVGATEKSAPKTYF